MVRRDDFVRCERCEQVVSVNEMNDRTMLAESLTTRLLCDESCSLDQLVSLWSSNDLAHLHQFHYIRHDLLLAILLTAKNQARHDILVQVSKHLINAYLEKRPCDLMQLYSLWKIQAQSLNHIVQSGQTQHFNALIESWDQCVSLSQLCFGDSQITDWAIQQRKQALTEISDTNNVDLFSLD